MDCTRGREIALDIFLNPNMVKNHLELGLQEIRGEILVNNSFCWKSYIIKTVLTALINHRAARVSKCKIRQMNFCERVNEYTFLVAHNFAFNHVCA